MRGFAGVLAVFVSLVLTACPPSQPLPDRLILSPASFSRLPGWGEDILWAAVPAFLRSCATLESRQDAEPFYRNQPSVGKQAISFGTIADWRAPCMAAKEIAEDNNNATRAFFEHWFQPYMVSNNHEREGLFTGYYEAKLHGSRTPSERYRVPLYRRPNDLVTVNLGLFRDDLWGRRIAGRVRDRQLVPFESRSQINQGALSGKKLELLWVDDPVDAFFLHIQGSGRVILDDGSVTRVSYDGQNGHSYVSVGRKLVDYGEMKREEVSMQSIRSWLKTHPEKAEKLLETNPSYIFFHELPVLNPETGPLGAHGVSLAPGRSLAVDNTFLALGVPLWLDTTEPAVGMAGSFDHGRPLRRLVIAQDTGGAIQGPVRGDFFWGFGEDAEHKAGLMNQPGRYFLLLPKSIDPMAHAREKDQ